VIRPPHTTHTTQGFPPTEDGVVAVELNPLGGTRHTGASPASSHTCPVALTDANPGNAHYFETEEQKDKRMFRTEEGRVQRV